jgi:hypothetical protein
MQYINQLLRQLYTLALYTLHFAAISPDFCGTEICKTQIKLNNYAEPDPNHKTFSFNITLSGNSPIP